MFLKISNFPGFYRIVVNQASFMSELKWNMELFMESILFSFDYIFNEFV